MTSDAVDQIKQRLSIVDVIQPYVELHKAGKNFKGKSPFTNERTPSFYVSPDRGMYYCFSTSQGGDMFTFIQTMEGMEFKEALRHLAEKANVELTPEKPEAKSQRERQFSVLDAAAQWYTDQLTAAPSVNDYFLQRGLREETIKNWRLGYAPGPPNAGWRELKTALAEQGYSDEELLRAGLIKSTDNSKAPYDVFRDRVMFPMRDASGRVVAFSGRILGKDSDAPKYVNSPETDLYHKSDLLFGYDKAKPAVRELGFWLIVEGQFDVVACHQAGYKNAVAVSGTALTEAHVKQMERLCDRAVLALDADNAGIRAMQRAAEVMLQRGFDVKVAELPSGQDPADILQADVPRFKKAIGQSVPVIECLLAILRSSAKDERAFKLQAREQVIPFVLLIPNRIDQEHFEQKIAEATGATKDAIHYEVERQRGQQQKTQTSNQNVSEAVSTEDDSNQTVAERKIDATAITTLEHRATQSGAYAVALSTVYANTAQQLVLDELTALQASIYTHEKANNADNAIPETVSQPTPDLLFTAEAFVAESTNTRVEQEIIYHLSRYAELLVRAEIQHTRTRLRDAEIANDVTYDTHLSRLLALQKLLPQTSYTSELFAPLRA